MDSDPINILVVDDEPHICDILSRWLKMEGYTCTAAANGTHAIEMLSHDNFALVVSDIMMPEMSGLELLQTIRAGCKTS